MIKKLTLTAAAMAVAIAVGCVKPSEKSDFAYITNGVDPFWDLCAAGVRIAEEEFGVKCEVLMPTEGVVDQKRPST